MGSPLLAATRTMTDIANLLTPIYDLLQDEVVREKVEESARVFFSNSNLTINLIPALIIGALGLLFLLPLLGIPILDILGGMMSDVVGGHGGGYSAPSTGYGYVARGDTSYYDQTIADLQQQVAALQESEANLRNSLYYNNPVGDGAQPPTMWATAPRQDFSSSTQRTSLARVEKIVLKTPTRQALENRGRGGENFGTRRLGVAVIQHLH